MAGVIMGVRPRTPMVGTPFPLAASSPNPPGRVVVAAMDPRSYQGYHYFGGDYQGFRYFRADPTPVDRPRPSMPDFTQATSQFGPPRWYTGDGLESTNVVGELQLNQLPGPLILQTLNPDPDRASPTPGPPPQGSS